MAQECVIIDCNWNKVILPRVADAKPYLGTAYTGKNFKVNAKNQRVCRLDHPMDPVLREKAKVMKLQRRKFNRSAWKRARSKAGV